MTPDVGGVDIADAGAFVEDVIQPVQQLSFVGLLGHTGEKGLGSDALSRKRSSFGNRRRSRRGGGGRRGARPRGG